MFVARPLQSSQSSSHVLAPPVRVVKLFCLAQMDCSIDEEVSPRESVSLAYPYLEAAHQLSLPARSLVVSSAGGRVCWVTHVIVEGKCARLILPPPLGLCVF